MNRDYLSKFLTEPGFIYSYGILPPSREVLTYPNTFCMWNGYFSDIYEALVECIGHKNLPIEFLRYHTGEEWQDEQGHDYLPIDADYTLLCLKTLLERKIKFRLDKGYDISTNNNSVNTCVSSLIEFLILHRSQQLYIHYY
ncbi:hypothetical protein IC235_08770 [Hymenobacter sp. BT664]|uniref:Uncharacterized protein n=1 Tax=Hymenobacter montanus TaxID=2771359 RepID=A0A927BD94_9BACT|nr:hypothetical protein [Hymenobacter montanus]MBD2767984.1 hypothetical protein [Hymenobacter montanus]